MPFNEDAAAIVEEFRPAVVSFHFGLPEPALVERVRKAGAKILSTATTVEEALWLEQNGADAIIAQGLEAGGHRGTGVSPRHQCHCTTSDRGRGHRLRRFFALVVWAERVGVPGEFSGGDSGTAYSLNTPLSQVLSVLQSIPGTNLVCARFHTTAPITSISSHSSPGYLWLNRLSPQVNTKPFQNAVDSIESRFCSRSQSLIKTFPT